MVEEQNEARDVGTRQETSRVFSLLKPACCAIVKSSTADNLQRLEELLRSFPKGESAALSTLQEYIVFPLNNVLQSKPKDETVLLTCLRCFELLWRKSFTKNQQMALNYLAHLSTLMASDKEMTADVYSEEVKLAAVLSCHQLWTSCSEQILKLVFSPRHTPMLGYLVFQLTSLIRTQKNRELRVAAISCLLSLSCRQWLESRYSLVALSSRVFVSFLPGILSALFSVISGDVKQGQHVISSAVDGFSAMLCHVIDDEISPTDTAPAEKGDGQGLRECVPLATRTEQWLRETVDRVSSMLERFVLLTRHHHRSVRLSVVRLCHRCFQHSFRSTEPLHEQLITLLLLLSCDSCQEVKLLAGQALHQVRDRLSHTAGGFSELLWNQLEQMLPFLPGRVRSQDPELACTAITLLEGYLRALAGDLKRLLLPESRTRRLLTTLVTLAELKPVGSIGAIRRICPSDQSSRCESVDGDQTVFLVTEPWRLVLCDTPDLWHHLCVCCHLVGCYGDVLTLLECLQGMTEYDNETKANQAQLIWNQVILGKLPDCSSSMSADSKLSDNKLSGCSGSLSANSKLSGSKQPDSTLSDSKLSSWQCQLPLDWLLQHVDDSGASDIKRCLALQAVAHAGRTSGPRDLALRQLQVRALAPVLEAAGSERQCVADMAMLTLYYLTANEGVKCTLRKHLPRLCVHLCSRLREHSREAAGSVSCMLRALLPHLTASEDDTYALFHLQLPIKQLLSFLDVHYQQCAEVILEALSRLMERFLDWFHVPGSSAGPLADPRPVPWDGVARFLAYHRQQLEMKALLKRDSSDFETEDTEDCDSGVNDCAAVSDSSENSPDQSAPVPLHVQLACLVCEHSSRLLDVDSSLVKVRVLQVLAAGFGVLCGSGCRQRQHEDEVLPLLHRCWQPLVRCVETPQTAAVVLMAALRCLETLASAGGDFLRRRFSEQLLRPLRRWLARAAAETAGCRRYYQLTTHCRLQGEAVRALSALCVSLRVDALCVVDTMDVLWPYLHCRQPPVLQDCGRDAITALARYNGDCVWWCLRHKSQQVPELEIVNYRTNLDSILSLPDLL